MQKRISRKRFLQICRTAIAGGSILGISGFILRKNRLLQNGGLSVSENYANGHDGHLISPYRLVSSFSVPDRIETFDLAGDSLIVAASNNIFIYDRTGRPLHHFSIRSNLRDLVADRAHIYLLFPARIEVYSYHGEKIREWEASGGSTDFCSIAVARDALFATDAANKNICRFTTDGNFVKFIDSPNGFVIPSYSFGIACVDDVVYCSNSGRHQVEKYSFDGDYLGAFGKAGGAAGMFCGCCNPVHIANTPSGEIITSEKGIPRISCYSRNGEFRSVLLDSKALGGGNTAYNVKVHDDRLLVAGGNQIAVFRYDKATAAKSACSGCDVNCRLRSS